MKGSRLSEEQIIDILKEHHAGRSAATLCPRHGIGTPTFYKWRWAVRGGIKPMESPKPPHSNPSHQHKSSVARSAP